MQDAYFMIEMCRLKLSLICLVIYQEWTVSSNVIIPTAIQFLRNHHLYDPVITYSFVNNGEGNKHCRCEQDPSLLCIILKLINLAEIYSSTQEIYILKWRTFWIRKQYLFWFCSSKTKASNTLSVALSLSLSVCVCVCVCVYISPISPLVK